ncbi:hypothetical protein V8G54_011047 [Vigna mungo]|uniref:Uncharacterized protein n=1 Tax=Vigna mungo TaxID=3915 RepID=A0AAQ3NNW5_VIGMU
MEGLWNSLLNQSCLKPFGFTPRLGYTFTVVTTRIRTLNRKPKSCTLRIYCTQLGRDTGASSEWVRVDALDNGGDGEESNVEWESEFLGEVDPLGYRAPIRKGKKCRGPRLVCEGKKETDETDIDIHFSFNGCQYPFTDVDNRQKSNEEVQGAVCGGTGSNSLN